MEKKGKKKQCQERFPNLGVSGGGPAPNRQALSGRKSTAHPFLPNCSALAERPSVNESALTDSKALRDCRSSLAPVARPG